MNDDQLDDLLRDAARSYNTPIEVPRELMWARIEEARAARTASVTTRGRSAPWLRTGAAIAAVLLAGIVIGRASRGGDVGDAGDVGAVASAPSQPSAAPVNDAPGEPLRVASGDDDSPAGSDGGTSPASTGAVGTLRAAAVRRVGALLGARAPRAATPAAVERGAYGVARNTPGVVGDGSEMNANRLAVVEHLARTEVLLTGFRAAEGARAATAADAEQFGRLSRELLQNTRLLLATRATDDPLLTRLLEDLELVLMQIAQYAAEGGARRGDLDAINHSLDRRNVLPKLRSTIPAGAPASPGT